MQRNVFVQDCDTKLLLAEDESWTSNAAQARDFHESLSAVTFCLQRKMARAQVLIKFNMTGASDVVVPISLRFTSSDGPAQ